MGSKPTIILHNCLIKSERYELVITPHRQTIVYIRSDQIRKTNTTKKELAKQKTNYQKKVFKKRRNAVSESDPTTIPEFHDLKDSLNKNNAIENQN